MPGKSMVFLSIASLLAGCGAVDRRPPGAVAAAPTRASPEPVEVWQEDAVAAVGSGATIVRIVKWSAWDVGQARGGTSVFSAVAVALGALDAAPEWTIYWDTTRPGEAATLAQALAREVGAPRSALAAAEIEAFGLLPAPGPGTAVETHEAREAWTVRGGDGVRLLLAIARGSRWSSRSTPSRQLELHAIDTLVLETADGPLPAVREGVVTRQRLWVRM